MSPARLEALRAMARQDVSPHERDIARDKLLAMGEGWDEPPKRPPAAPTPTPQPQWSWSTTTSTSNWTTSTFYSGTIYIRVEVG